MKKEEIIRMAREAGLMGNPLAYADWYPEALERFAALVAAKTSAAAKAEERDGFGKWRDTSGADCATAIRARSNN